MEGLRVQAEIDVSCCRATRRRRELESSIGRRDRRRIIGEWALHRQDGIFGTDTGQLLTQREILRHERCSWRDQASDEQKES